MIPPDQLNLPPPPSPPPSPPPQQAVDSAQYDEPLQAMCFICMKQIRPNEPSIICNMCPAHYHLFEIYGSLGIRRQNGNPRCMGCDTDMSWILDQDLFEITNTDNNIEHDIPHAALEEGIDNYDRMQGLQ